MAGHGSSEVAEVVEVGGPSGRVRGGWRAVSDEQPDSSQPSTGVAGSPARRLPHHQAAGAAGSLLSPGTVHPLPFGRPVLLGDSWAASGPHKHHISSHHDLQGLITL